MRKLLSSHHSVYDALTDPLLDMPEPSHPPLLLEASCSLQSTIKAAGGFASVPNEQQLGTNEGRIATKTDKDSKDNEPKDEELRENETKRAKELRRGRKETPLLEMPRPLNEPLAFLWQSINLPPLHDVGMRFSSLSPPQNSRPESASILSNSTDDEAGLTDSMVLVPSLKKSDRLVLVFETDEEDEDDSGKTSAMPHFPKRIELQRNLLSFIMPQLSFSSDSSVHTMLVVSSPEMNGEAPRFVASLQEHLAHIRLEHLVLAADTLLANTPLSARIDLLLVVNDGSSCLAEAVKYVAQGLRPPKLVVVNMLPCNYFLNLFDIITAERPAQIFKTTELCADALLQKILSLVSKPPSDGQALIPPSMVVLKPDYKTIERDLRQEMALSRSLEAIDPLQLSSNLSYLKLLAKLVPKDNKDWLTNERFWFACSFSIGIGIGLTLNALQFFRAVKHLLLSEEPAQVAKASRGYCETQIASHAGQAASHIFVRMESVFRSLAARCLELAAKPSELVMNSMLSRLQSGSTVVIDSALNGFWKLREAVSLPPN